MMTSVIILFLVLQCSINSSQRNLMCHETLSIFNQFAVIMGIIFNAIFSIFVCTILRQFVLVRFFCGPYERVRRWLDPKYLYLNLQISEILKTFGQKKL